MTLSQVVDVFPEWRGLVREERDEDGTSFEVLAVAAPEEANVEHGLVIDTSRSEITVGFDFYHSHFDDWTGDGEHFGTKAALEFIKQIISEKIAVVSWWGGNIWCGSAPIEGGHAPGLPSWTVTESINRIRVRSWRGTHNADLDV
jgi:hypothetical protein